MTHDDLTTRIEAFDSRCGETLRRIWYAKVRAVLDFDARAVDNCGIKNGLGEVVRKGEAGW